MIISHQGKFHLPGIPNDPGIPPLVDRPEGWGITALRPRPFQQSFDRSGAMSDGLEQRVAQAIGEAMRPGSEDFRMAQVATDLARAIIAAVRVLREAGL